MQEYMNCYEIQIRRPAHAVPVVYHVLAVNLESTISTARKRLACDFGTEEVARAEVFSVKEIARAVVTGDEDE